MGNFSQCTYPTTKLSCLCLHWVLLVYLVDQDVLIFFFDKTCIIWRVDPRHKLRKQVSFASLVLSRDRWEVVVIEAVGKVLFFDLLEILCKLTFVEETPIVPGTVLAISRQKLLLKSVRVDVFTDCLHTTNVSILAVGLEPYLHVDCCRLVVLKARLKPALFCCEDQGVEADDFAGVVVGELFGNQ